MRYRKLRGLDTEVSVVCCGAMAYGRPGPDGKRDDDASVEAVHAALDAGVNFFDTAEAYSGGESEVILGRALDGCRDDVVIATKVTAAHLREPDLIASCEASLRRLGIETIDIYQVHWPRHEIPFADTAGILDRLREQGKIRAWGVSNFGPLDTADAVAAGPPIVNQLPYSLLWRAIEHGIVPVCVENDVGILCYSPMAQGLLSGKYASIDEVPANQLRARYCHDGAVALSFRIIAELRDVAAGLGEPMTAVALAWLLARKGVTSVIAGMRLPKQARENARAGDLDLPEEAISRLTEASDELKSALDMNPDMWQAGDASRYR